MKAPKYLYFRVKTVNHGTALDIEDASDVDVVEVVRCKDCRYYNAEEKECLDLMGYGRRWEEDDFCSYGVKMEEVTE